MNSYYRALIIATAGLTIKSVIIKTLNIRARITLEQFKWPEDRASSVMKAIIPLFKALFLTSIPYLNDKDSLDRFLAIDENNTNNEFWLLLSAATWGVVNSGNPGAQAITVLYSLVTCRSLHNFFWIAKLEPHRTFAFLPGFFGTLYLAGATLSKIMK